MKPVGTVTPRYVGVVESGGELTVDPVNEFGNHVALNIAMLVICINSVS